MTPKLTAEIIEHILEFIRARNFNYTADAVKYQKWLKEHLGESYHAVLLKHGDPDKEGYWEVMARWWKERIHAK